MTRRPDHGSPDAQGDLGQEVTVGTRCLHQADRAGPADAAPATELALLYTLVRDVLAEARGQAHRSVNRAMVQAYWQVGRLIVEHEQAGKSRAAYGSGQLDLLARRLSAEFGPGFAVQSLRNFWQLYVSFPGEEIRSTPWSELGWSHLKVLMRVSDPAARAWYAAEAVRETWSVGRSQSPGQHPLLSAPAVQQRLAPDNENTADCAFAPQHRRMGMTSDRRRAPRVRVDNDV